MSDIHVHEGAVVNVTISETPALTVRSDGELVSRFEIGEEWAPGGYVFGVPGFSPSSPYNNVTLEVGKYELRRVLED